ncbi:MAG: NifU family protein [Myxococcota bacterium]|nr:NifU family protein [Myxococcota bacterium]
MIKSFIKRLLGRDQSPAQPPAPANYPFKYREPEAGSQTSSAGQSPAPAQEAAPVEEVQSGVSDTPAPTSPDPVAAESSTPEPAPEVTPAAPEPVVEPIDYNSWTVKKLRAELEELGVELRSRMKKAELVELMEAQSAPAEEAPAASGDGLDPVVVQELLDDMVRPALQADGGDITLIKTDGMDVYVKLVGACSTCPSSIMTMKMGVEALFREEFENFGDLIQVE